MNVSEWFRTVQLCHEDLSRKPAFIGINKANVSVCLRTAIEWTRAAFTFCQPVFTSDDCETQAVKK